MKHEQPEKDNRPTTVKQNAEVDDKIKSWKIETWTNKQTNTSTASGRYIQNCITNVTNKCKTWTTENENGPAAVKQNAEFDEK